MKARLTRAASTDLRSILTYLAERNPAAASAFVAALEMTIARLEQHPLSARETDERGNYPSRHPRRSRP